MAAVGLVLAGGASEARAQQDAPVSGPELAQADPAPATGSGDAEIALDDAELLTRVMAALPPGVTIETATDAQLALAVSTVIAAVVAGPGGQMPGAAPSVQPNIAAVASRVLAVVTVSLDAIGRSDASNAVATRVVGTLPPQARAQVQQQVQASRANPTPTQAAAAAVVIAQVQPAVNQQQPAPQIVLTPPPAPAPVTVENPSQTGGGAVVGGDDDDDTVSPS